MALFFTSDTHFGHARIIELCKRPFESVEAMDETIIANWNAVVGPRDEVWHLGDFSYSRVNAQGIFDRLNGRKSLIVGNHDDNDTVNMGWENIQHIHEVRYQKRKIVLCHYPFLEWPGYFRQALHIHGHQHNDSMWEPGRTAIDVGVDATGFKPVSVDIILQLWTEFHLGHGEAR